MLLIWETSLFLHQLLYVSKCTYTWHTVWQVAWIVKKKHKTFSTTLYFQYELLNQQLHVSGSVKRCSDRTQTGWYCVLGTVRVPVHIHCEISQASVCAFSTNNTMITWSVYSDTVYSQSNYRPSFFKISDKVKHWKTPDQMCSLTAVTDWLIVRMWISHTTI